MELREQRKLLNKDITELEERLQSLLGARATAHSQSQSGVKERVMGSGGGRSRPGGGTIDTSDLLYSSIGKGDGAAGHGSAKEGVKGRAIEKHAELPPTILALLEEIAVLRAQVTCQGDNDDSVSTQ